MAIELDTRTVLKKEVENLGENIDKMHITIENSKLDLAATKLIRDSLLSYLESIPEQQEILLSAKE